MLYDKETLVKSVKEQCRDLAWLIVWVTRARESKLPLTLVLDAMVDNWDGIIHNASNLQFVARLFKTEQHDYKLEIARSFLSHTTRQTFDKRLVIITQALSRPELQELDTSLARSFAEKKKTYEQKNHISTWILAHQNNRWVRRTLYPILKFFQPLRVAKLETLTAFAPAFKTKIGERAQLFGDLESIISAQVEQHKYRTKAQIIRAMGKTMDREIAADQKTTLGKLWTPRYTPQARWAYYEGKGIPAKTAARTVCHQLTHKDGEFYNTFFKQS